MRTIILAPLMVLISIVIAFPVATMQIRMPDIKTQHYNTRVFLDQGYRVANGTFISLNIWTYYTNLTYPAYNQTAANQTIPSAASRLNITSIWDFLGYWTGDHPILYTRGQFMQRQYYTAPLLTFWDNSTWQLHNETLTVYENYTEVNPLNLP